LSVLGPLEVRIDGAVIDLGRGGRRGVLAALILAEGAVVPTEQLVRDVWGDPAPENARTMLYGHVSRLRQLLGGDPIVTHPHGYSIQGAGAILDSVGFREDLALAERAATGDEIHDALSFVERALGRWRGATCEGLNLLGQAAVAAEELQAEHDRAAITRLELLLRAGRSARAIPDLERLAMEQPLDEGVYRLLALAYVQSGRQVEALTVLHDIRTRLRDELGVDPTQELTDLEDAVRRQDIGSLGGGGEPRRHRVRWVSIARIALRPISARAMRGAADLAARIRRSLALEEAEVLSVPGEGLVAAWGLRDTEADVAVRAASAVRAAIDAARSAPSADELLVSAAVATGRAVIGEGEGPGALGEAEPAFEAARLLATAVAGEVLIDRTTAALLPPRTRLEVHERGMRLLATPPATGPTGPIGRDEEAATLANAWERCAGGPAGICVVVTGPPGIGKTSLIEAFLGRTAITSVRVRCHRNAVEPALDRLCAALDELRAGDDVSRRGSADAATGEALPSLEHQYLRARSALAELGEAPFAVFIDDFQWASAAFRSALARLQRSTRGRPVLFLIGSRDPLDDEDEPVPDLSIELSPLAPRDAELVLRQTADVDLPPAVAEQILLAADGNPLFLRQSAAFGAEALRASEGEAAIPATVALVLHARLERLARADRAVLEAVAVLGDHLDEEALAALVPARTRGSLEATLTELAASGWLQSPEGTIHELLREAVLDGMTPQTRADRHAEAAASFDARIADGLEHALVVGTHLEASELAHREIDDRPSASAAIAASLLASAAWRLGERGGHAAATDLLERASALRGLEDAQGCELAVEHAHALVESGRLDEARRRLAAVADVASSFDEPPLEAYRSVVSSALALYASEEPGAVLEAEREVSAAIPILQESGRVRGAEFGTYLLAWLHFLRGQLTAADRVIAGLQEARPEGAGAVVQTIPATLLEGDAPLTDDALATVEETLPGFEGSRLAERLGQMAALCSLRGDRGRTLDAADRALRLAGEIDLPVTIGAVSLNAGVAAHRLGLPDLAERHLRRSERSMALAGNGSFRSTALASLARVLVDRGDLDQAAPVIELARGLCADEDLETRIIIGAVWGRVGVAAGREEGLDHVREAVALARRTEFLVQRCDALVDLARCLVARERTEEAAEAVGEALEGLDRKLAVGAATRVREEFGRLIGDALTERPSA
jgi:DNA-binding SARP family transcriptional activator